MDEAGREEGARLGVGLEIAGDGEAGGFGEDGECGGFGDAEGGGEDGETFVARGLGDGLELGFVEARGEGGRKKGVRGERRHEAESDRDALGSADVI